MSVTRLATLLVALAACAASSGLAAPTTTIKVHEKKDRTVIKIKNAGALYYEPVPTAAVVTRVDLDAPVTLLEDRGEWVRVSSATGDGWIQRTYVDWSAPGGPEVRKVWVRQPASVYYDPDVQARVVEQLPVRTGVTLVEDRGDWMRVRTTAAEGWVQKTYFDFADRSAPTVRRVMVRQPTPLYFEPRLEARVLEDLPLEAPITFVSDEGDWIRVRTVSHEGWVRRTTVDFPGYVLAGPLTLRYPTSLLGGPEVGARAIMPVGTDVQLTLIEQQGDWIHVRSGETDGWIPVSYVRIP